MNALERAQRQRKEAAAPPTTGTSDTARAALVTRLKAIDADKIIPIVERLGLPSTTGKWTLEQLRDVVVEAETGKPLINTPTDRMFILVYNSENALLSVSNFDQATWDALVPEEGQSALVAASADDLGDVPTDVLLAAFNQGKGTKAKKFADPSTAREQAFASFAAIVDGTTSKAAVAAKKAAPKEPKTPKEVQAPKLMNKDPKAKEAIKQVGAGTKIAQLIDLLARKEGTTVAEIESTLSAVGKPVSARAWLGYDLNSVAGYGVRQDGERLYIVYPAGMTAPLLHKVREAPKPPTPTKKTAPAEPVAETPAPAPGPVEESVAETPAPPTKKAAPAVPAKKAAPAKKGSFKK